MRRCLFGLWSALVLLIGGCAHNSGPYDDAWPSPVAQDDAARPHVAHNDVSNRRDGSNWAPIKTVTDSSLTDTSGPDWSTATVHQTSLRGPHAVARADGPYLLDTGDQLRIFVYGQPNLSRIYIVDHDGNVMLPLIGLIKARRRTTYSLAGIIRARLGTQYVRDPQVTVDMHQNRPFFILGEVRTPGQYPYVSGMTVETAVAIAGGFSARANTRKFRVSRRVNGDVEVVKGPKEHVVRPGDTITVSERFF